MNLASPITVQTPSITRKDGQVMPPRPITLTELDVTIMDSNKRKIALAQIRPFPRPLELWKDAAYDAAGDYTQAQVEARVLELLGSNPKAVLEGLFVIPVPTGK